MARASWGRRYRTLAEHASSILLQRGMLPTKKLDGGSQLILMFNSMFGDHYLPPTLPVGFELSTDLRRFREARVVVFHIPSLGRIERLRKPLGQQWVAWWMECDQHLPRLADRAFMSRFDLTMSYHLDADLFLPYFHFRQYSDGEQRLRAEPHPKHGLAALFMSGPFDKSGRTAYAAELMRHMPVSSYGRVLRNRRLTRDHGESTKRNIIAGFKFTLAFENAIATDYVTEKLYEPLAMGSVPVYLGAPNADRLAPTPDCYIDVTHFPEPKSLAEYLLELDRDEDAYRRHLAWKGQSFRPEFQAILDMQPTHFLVRLCELLRRTGLDSRA
jgi:hypothetical protein